MSSTAVATATATPATSSNLAAAAKPKTEKEQKEIINNFQRLREEQRMIATKTAELQIELKSHELVIETLKEVEKDRKCFRMIGGVLVERTVNEVLPALEQNKDQIAKLIENFQTQITSKGQEINEFREKNNIRFQGEQDLEQKSSPTKDSNQNKTSGGVLVEKSS